MLNENFLYLHYAIIACLGEEEGVKKGHRRVNSRVVAILGMIIDVLPTIIDR